MPKFTTEMNIYGVIVCLLKHGQFNALNDLIGDGIDLNVRRGGADNRNDTPLIWVIREKREAVVKYLINRGADIWKPTGKNLNITPYEVLRATGDSEFFKGLKDWLRCPSESLTPPAYEFEEARRNRAYIEYSVRHGFIIARLAEPVDPGGTKAIEFYEAEHDTPERRREILTAFEARQG